MNMKVVGGIAILIAALLGWLAISAAIEANGMREQTSAVNTGWTKMINDATGVSQINENKIKTVETMSTEFVIGAVIMVIVGAGFMIGKQHRNNGAG